MSERVAALVAEFEKSAKEAQQAETALRRQMAEEIARLERQRAFAFRRISFIRMLAAGAAGMPTEEEAHAAQCQALSEELGWYGESEARQAILEEMKPLGRSVWQCVSGATPVEEGGVPAELEKFESWFQATRGTVFYTLFDVYIPEVPLVDF